MIKAALLSVHAIEKCKRQLPNARTDFEGVEFFVPVNEAEIVFVFDALPEAANSFNHVKVVLERPVPTVFVAAEPKSVKQYNPAFLSQFSAVITSDRETPHFCRIFTQQAVPWHVGSRSANGKILDVPMSFEELENHNPHKTKLVSVVSSDKRFTAGHRARLAFVAKLKKALGDEVDVFGRGINDFGDKREVLDAYRYHIAIENCAAEDYWTEKLADPYLTQTFPIYHGCPNIADYFSEKAMRVIDIYQPDRAIEIIREVISSDLAETSKSHLLEARRRVMYEHNIFNMLAKVAKELVVEQNHPEKRCKRRLYPERHFAPFAVKLKRRLKYHIRKLLILGKALRLLMKTLKTSNGRF